MDVPIDYIKLSLFLKIWRWQQLWSRLGDTLEASKDVLFKSFKGVSEHLVSDQDDYSFVHRGPLQRAFLIVRRLIHILREHGLQDK